MSLIISLALALVAAGPDDAQAKKAPDPTKKICRTMSASTGSIMPARKTCHTAAEWAQIDGGNQVNRDRFLDSTRGQQGLRPSND